MIARRARTPTRCQKHCRAANLGFQTTGTGKISCLLSEEVRIRTERATAQELRGENSMQMGFWQNYLPDARGSQENFSPTGPGRYVPLGGAVYEDESVYAPGKHEEAVELPRTPATQPAFSEGPESNVSQTVAAARSRQNEVETLNTKVHSEYKGARICGSYAAMYDLMRREYVWYVISRRSAAQNQIAWLEQRMSERARGADKVMNAWLEQR